MTLNIDDKVSITAPGRNRSASWGDAKKMGAKWFRGIPIMDKKGIYDGTIWHVVNIKEERNSKYKLCLIRNKSLELDLLISEQGIMKIIDFITDTDIFI